MIAVVWIAENTWEACVDRARELIPERAEVRLVYIQPSDVVGLLSEGSGGLLGRRHSGFSGSDIAEIAAQEGAALLDAARARLGRAAQVRQLVGHPERELLRECADADLLVLARDGEERLGPKSFGRETRFVTDHAPCAVMVVWPGRPPSVESLKLPPHLRHGSEREGPRHGPHGPAG